MRKNRCEIPGTMAFVNEKLPLESNWFVAMLTQLPIGNARLVEASTVMETPRPLVAAHYLPLSPACLKKSAISACMRPLVPCPIPE